MQTPKKKRSCTVVAKPFYENQQRQSVTHNNKIHKLILWRVLLDSGPDVDLVFLEKEKKNSVPILKRQVPQVWHTSNGHLKTENQALMFPEYSVSKQVMGTPHIVYYNSGDPSPKFDLIIRTQIMERLGIILDCKTKMISIDKKNLPMRYIRNLQVETREKIL